jgi:probable rRNA maturation factor
VKQTLHLTITRLVSGPSTALLEKHLLKAHRLLGSPLRDLSIAIVGRPLMKQLHQRYMNDPNSTDVLTFELEKDKLGRTLAGEIVICLPVARQAAQRRKIPVTHELVLYALHGMLHLGGWDDRTVAGYRAMHEKEDQILIQLGIGPVFRPAKRRNRPAKLGARR